MRYYILIEGELIGYGCYTETSARASLSYQSTRTGKLAVLYFEKTDGSEGMRAVGHCYPNHEPMLYVDPVTFAWTDLITAVRKAFGI